MGGICVQAELGGSLVDQGGLLAMGAAAAHGSEDLEGGAKLLCREAVGMAALGRRYEAGLEIHEGKRGVFLVASDARLDNRSELCRELREEFDYLRADSGAVSFSTLILAAYLRWGEGAAERLLGDFAFVLWDEKARCLVFCRDPLGVKSLHYHWNGGRVLLGTEIRQLLMHPEVDRSLDEQYAGDYLCGNIPEQGRTLFASIRQVPPGHWGRVQATGLTLSAYWCPDPHGPSELTDPREAAEALAAALSRAVADRLDRSSGPIGVSLSGGLDSGSVASLAHRALGGGPEAPLVLGSMTFPSLPSCDERSWVEAFGSAIGHPIDWIDAEVFSFDPEAALIRGEGGVIDEGWEEAYGEMLQRMQRQGCRVLLTGIGGDDLLAGGPSVYADRFSGGDLLPVAELWHHARKQGKNPLYFLYCYLIAPFVSANWDLRLRRWTGRTRDFLPPTWLNPAFSLRSGLLERNRAARPKAGWGRKAKAEIFDNITPGSFGSALHWLDRKADRWGMEARHPFLDRRLAELVLTIAPEALFVLGEYKPVLRQAMRGVLPEKIRMRVDKTRLSAYADQTMRHIAEDARKLFTAPMLETLGLVEGVSLRQALEEYLIGKNGEDSRRVWTAMLLEIWLRRQYSQTHRSEQAEIVPGNNRSMVITTPAQA